MKKFLVAIFTVLAVGLAARADELASSYDIISRVHYETSNVAISTQIISIDVSDLVNYPHLKNGSIALAGIRTTFSTPATSSGTIKFGVVTFVNTSSGTVKWFANYPYSTTAINTFNFSENFTPMYLRALVKPIINTGGTTPYFNTNSTTANSTLYQTDVVLPTSVGGSTAPGIGDIIMAINIGVGSINDISSEIFYAGQKP